MFELVFIGFLVFGGLYIFFFLIYSSIKEEKDFAMDVYRYLSRRYPQTQIVDYGGISSDPIVHSRNAGPFKLIEVKVITENDDLTNRKDQDLILRGEVDYQRFKEVKRTANLSLFPQSFSRGSDVNDIELGIPRLDNRFFISSQDPILPRQILFRTDLGDLIQKSFDLEGYHIRFESGGLIIQIRMETMSSNSFIQAFNILLGTVGTLSEKGYLSRKTSGIEIQEEKTQSITEPIEHKTVNIPNIQTESYGKPVNLMEESKDEFKATINTQEKDISKPMEGNISWEPHLKDSKDMTNQIEKNKQQITVESVNKHLFSSIRYQAKEIQYNTNQVRIFTYSRATPEIVVVFPGENQTLFTTFFDRTPTTDFEIQMDNKEDGQPIDWSDQWKSIVISGPNEIVDKLKTQTGIAHRINNAGYCVIRVKGQKNKGIDLEITVSKTLKGINAGYSLLKEIVWFLEMLFV